MNDICPYYNQPALSLGEGLSLVVSRAWGTGPPSYVPKRYQQKKCPTRFLKLHL